MNARGLSGKTREVCTPRRRTPYLAPEQRPGESWVPAGRALHVIDLENLMGGPRGWTSPQLRDLVDAFGLASDRRDGDHVIVASHPALAFEVAEAFPAAKQLVRRGTNGADAALLEAIDPADVARRFSRVVVGSGDGAFASKVRDLCVLGTEVVVIALRGSLSRELARSATRVVYLTPTATTSMLPRVSDPFQVSHVGLAALVNSQGAGNTS